MIRACDECGNVFAPTYPDQWACDECDDRRTRECFARLEEIEHGRAQMEEAAREQIGGQSSAGKEAA
jgi:hypothetical protein